VRVVVWSTDSARGYLLTLTRLLLFLAFAGLISCTGFLFLTIVSALRFRRRASQPTTAVPPFPKVTVLKPLCGLEPNLEANIESFFRQDYPDFEIIFGTRDANDAALETVRRLQQRYAQVSTKTVFSGEPDRPNAKVCSLQRMYARGASDYFVISDSDVEVGANYLREVIAPLQNSGVGLVTCLYRGVPTGGLWSRLEALGMSVEMTSGVIVAEILEGMRFALGPTMAARRDTIDGVGGMALLADYCADDYVLGHAVYASGRKVELSTHVIDHIVNHRSFKSSLLHQLRWMKSTRFSRPMGHIGSVLTFAMPYGLLGMLVGVLTGHPVLGWGLLAWAVLNRMLMAIVAGWGVVRDPYSLRDCWLYPLRDLLGFFLWCASFTGRTVVWRGTHYRLESGGKMVRVGTAEPEKPSGSITVDNLA
jgi:ceramide glucosyltransferase